MDKRQAHAEAIRRLQERKNIAEEKAERFRARFFSEHNELLAFENQVQVLRQQLMRAVLAGDLPAVEKATARLKVCMEEQNKCFQKYGVSEQDFQPQYTCKKCDDTGICKDAGGVCDCLQSLQHQILSESLSKELAGQNCTFENFSLDYYPIRDEDGCSPRESMRKNYEILRQYALTFHDHSENLLLSGRTGLGKTHLSLAVAQKVLEQGYTAVYNSAQKLFSQLEREKFGRIPGDTENTLYECDLLILDDLGTEFNSAFSQSVLYSIINTRLLAGKATVISSNLSLKEIDSRYGERISSRLLGNYRKIYFSGTDVRILLNQNKCSAE